MSQVYFARAAKTGFIKIGYSSNPAKRLSALQVSSADRVSIILTVPGRSAEERAFHGRFRESHERGEWFREEGELLKFLKSKKLDLASSNAAAEDLFVNELKRGFCKNPGEMQELYDFGVPDKNVYMQGRGAETLDACLATFRDRPGRLILACDLRIFGAKRGDIIVVMDRLELAKIRVTDITHPEDKTHVQLIERGSKAASKVRFLRNSRAARRVGQIGGIAKGEAAKARRNAEVSDNIAKRLCTHPKLNWKDCADILGMSVASIHRHYS